MARRYAITRMMQGSTLLRRLIHLTCGRQAECHRIVVTVVL